MAQIPIQTGVQVKDGAFQVSYPVNLQHKIVDSGVSKGQLVTTRGARQLSTGPGSDRGGIEWNGVHYRVMGDKLVSVAIDGTVTELGTVANDGLPCRFTFGFDRLGIASAEVFYYWTGALTQVTDVDLKPVIDAVWVDGYFATTDGTYVVVTDLNNPLSVNPLRYGSAETDPDAITGLANLREELLVIGRYTIQPFQNVGGTGFPFQTVRGAMIPYGCISPHAKCEIAGTLAFVGGGKNEPLGVYLVTGGSALKISDEPIDDLLNAAADQTSIELEGRKFDEEHQLVVHAGASSASISLRASDLAQTTLWHRLQSRSGRYRPRHAVFAYGAHYVADADSEAIGVLDETITAHFGEEPGWSLDAGLLYGEGASFIVHEVEIAGQFPARPSAVFMSMTRDGELWSNEIALRLSGQRGQRVVWRPNVRIGMQCGFRFRGFGKASITRADGRGEGLAT